MTDQDIIKSLEICYEQEEKCGLCPMHKEETLSGMCWNKLVIEALNLIRRQQTEINRLKNLCKHATHIENVVKEIHASYFDTNNPNRTEVTK